MNIENSINNHGTDDDMEVICDCTGTTKAKIKQLIENGKDNLDKISSATGAVTGCGSCDVLILEILAEHVKPD